MAGTPIRTAGAATEGSGDAAWLLGSGAAAAPSVGSMPVPLAALCGKQVAPVPAMETR